MNETPILTPGEPQSEPVSFIYPLPLLETLQVVLLGAFVGAGAALLSRFISTVIIEPQVCGVGQNFAVCALVDELGFSVALLLLSILSLFVLVRWQTYQPLLNVVAPCAALWGLQQLLSPVWQEGVGLAVIVNTLLFALCYGAFYALLRIRSFALSFVAVLIVVILIRLQLH